MSLAEKWHKLPLGWRIGLTLGGGTALVVGAIAALTGDDVAKKPAALPEPGPGPTPLPFPVKETFQTTYRGVTASIATDPDTATYPGYWIAIFEIDGVKTGIHARTNETGIVRRFRAAVDDFYASAQWIMMGLAAGATLRAGTTYRLSLPSSASVAFPAFSLPRKQISFSQLPEDWPADDRDEPGRLRYELYPTTDFDVPSVPEGRAWALSSKAPPLPERLKT